MEAHVWKLEFKTGNDKIDQEHAILLGMFNSLKQAIISGEETSFILYIVQQLMAYGVEHIAHEEQLMEENAYPHIETHKRAHQALKRDLFQLSDVIEQKDIGREAALFHVHHAVYHEHLLVHDKKFGEFLAAKRREW